ncbi:hypothetical protein [Pararhodobacter sp.]|uniref:hypothetical protein n=1 Tax=Pararhodobacter sp. TaxID=2127056 RepID=UPI002FDDC060
MSDRDWNLPAPRHARYRIEYITRAGYVICAPDGAHLPGVHLNRDLAEERRDALQAEADRKARRGPRPCMCCGQTFFSEGIHNRMCTPCRGRSDHMAEIAFAGEQDGRKPRRAARV